jgi:hypothetical protein
MIRDAGRRRAPGRGVHAGAAPQPTCHGAPRTDVLASLPLEIDMSLVPTPAALPCTDALTDFVAHARLMLDPATPESVRRETEPRLLAQLPTMQALGVFELFTIRDPALHALVQDELAARHCARRLSVVAGA